MTALGKVPRALLDPWVWKMAWRDSRAQRRRLSLVAFSLVAGIAALVAIHALRATLENSLAGQAKALLGSDLQISSRDPLPEAEIRQAAPPDARIARETSFSSMLANPADGAARLVQVRAIEGPYPFYGRIETSPPGAWDALSRQPGILVEPNLLDQFGAAVGDRLRLGSLELPILGTITQALPRSARFGGFASEVYIRLTDLPATGLLGRMSLAQHVLHLRLPDGAAAAALKKHFKDRGWRWDTPEDRRDRLGDVLDDVQQFLGVLGMAALVLGAVGVASAIRAHLSKKLVTVAVLRCLGCTVDRAFAVFLAQALALGAAGALLGAGLGVALETATLAVFGRRLPVPVEAAAIPWDTIAVTALAGLAFSLGFAVAPLAGIRRISPAQALREDTPPVPPAAWWRRLAAGAAGAVILAALLAFLSGTQPWRGFLLASAVGLAFLLLAGTAAFLAWLARRLVRPAWPYVVRQGVSNLYRPHNQTIVFILALGLGTFLLTTVLLCQNLVLARIDLTRHDDSPNVYLVDVQSDQVDAVRRLVQSLGLPVLEASPMVTMRLAAVKGVPVRDLEAQKRAPRWVLQREYRSSYRPNLNATEKIVAGQWLDHVPDPAAPVPVSLEKGIAEDLGVGIGDVLELDVQGVPLPARVASLREVDWGRFQLNFFMLFPPGVLEGAPGFHVVTTRIPEGASSGALQREIARRFPNISAVDLTTILGAVRVMLERAATAVRVLAGFSVVSGLVVLAGALLSSRDQRLRESVLLRTLGASRRQVRAILVVEFLALGALAALAGTGLAAAANAALALAVFKASPWPSLLVLAAAFFVVTFLSVAAGLMLTRGVCSHPPLEILRRE